MGNLWLPTLFSQHSVALYYSMEEMEIQPLFEQMGKDFLHQRPRSAAQTPVALHKNFALLQTVHPGGKLQLERRLLGVCQEYHP